jgi:hypothetical protein
MKLRNVWVAMLLGLTALCYAPIGETVDPSEYYQESSNEQLAEQQRGNRVTDATGSFPSPDTPDISVSQESEAYDALNQASAVDALEKGAEDAEEEKSPWWRKVLFGGFFLAFGLGMVQLVRVVADRKVPKPKKKEKVRW